MSAEPKVAALKDLRLGVEMDRHNLPDADVKLAALDAAIAALSRQDAQIAAGDAVFAFAGMLTSLPHVVPFGSAAWATPGADLADAFNRANGLTISVNYPDGLKFPNIEGDLLATVAKAAQPEQQGAGDAQKRFEEWYTENAFDYEKNPISSRECGLMRKAWLAALAARQPAGQEPVMWRYFSPDANCYWTRDVKPTSETSQDGTQWEPLYAAPPAQVDLGKYREAVKYASRACPHADLAQDLIELLALIDQQAGKGVRHG